ncbi:hypothetical protein HC931_08275 [Candidatus Gracilibacteria bacterium]|nr:hypothetical protein [Candidatus Gracilibacteria bacterium]
MTTLLYSLFLLNSLYLTFSSSASSFFLVNTTSSIKSQPIAQYSFEDYKKECLQRATNEKLPPDVAQDLCNCTMNQFRSQYSIDEFRTLVQKSKNNSTAAETLSLVGESCFEEVLYEE